MAKELKFVMLLDCYSELLTQHQRNIMELYYYEDLSLSEIGEPLGITRQAVRSIIKRTEELLEDYENKLGFAEKSKKMRDCLGRINVSASLIKEDSIREAIMSDVAQGTSLL